MVFNTTGKKIASSSGKKNKKEKSLFAVFGTRSDVKHRL